MTRWPQLVVPLHGQRALETPAQMVEQIKQPRILQYSFIHTHIHTHTSDLSPTFDNYEIKAVFLTSP